MSGQISYKNQTVKQCFCGHNILIQHYLTYENPNFYADFLFAYNRENVYLNAKKIGCHKEIVSYLFAKVILCNIIASKKLAFQNSDLVASFSVRQLKIFSGRFSSIEVISYVLKWP